MTDHRFTGFPRRFRRDGKSATRTSENQQSSTVEPDTTKLTTSAALPPHASDGTTTATKGNSTFTKIVDSVKQMPTILFATYVFTVIGVIGWFTPLKTSGIIAALVGIVTGIVSLIKNRKNDQHKRNSIIATIVCVVALLGCAATAPASSSSTQAESTAASSAPSTEASSSETTSSTPTQDPRLPQAQQDLQSKLTEANTLLASSENQVADESTRVALTQAITAASAVTSENPDDYTQAQQSLQSAMDAVTSSEQQKQAADAAAQQAAQEEASREAEQQAQQQAAQQAQQQAAQQAQQQAQQQATQSAQKPTQSTQSNTNTGKTIRRGEFCSKSRIGEQATASNGGTVTCTADGNRARWK
ncbi:hypothetical protein [Pseudoscardovia radai]|nr:hypothetical protein [Pseudoscardovia radai]